MELKDVRKQILSETNAKDIKCSPKYAELALRMIFSNKEFMEQIKYLFSKKTKKEPIIRIEKARPYSHTHYSGLNVSTTQYAAVNNLVAFVNSKRYCICNMDNLDPTELQDSNPYHDYDYCEEIPAELQQFIPKKLNKRSKPKLNSYVLGGG